MHTSPSHRAARTVAALLTLSVIALPTSQPATAAAAAVTGIDVSGYQGSVDWAAVARSGVDFAYVKATEGTTYRNPKFAQQYVGSYDAGLIRGAYHFALPDRSSGAAQAGFFVDHGGGWSGDGKTLPPVLDIEYNPYGATCYGKSKAQMVAWINDFAATVKQRTSRDVVIYTTADWWNRCTGSSTAFVSTSPLWVANYGASSPALPSNWPVWTIWQYSSSGTVPGVSGNVDVNRFNGDQSRLQALADG
jgi:GH25 family lysozyme M1 (1,4-beta-N-acetylmuramidase)